jgi:hypothetical protein
MIGMTGWRRSSGEISIGSGVPEASTVFTGSLAAPAAIVLISASVSACWATPASGRSRCAPASFTNFSQFGQSFS